MQAKNGYGNQAVTNEMQRVPALMGLLANVCWLAYVAFHIQTFVTEVMHPWT